MKTPILISSECLGVGHYPCADTLSRDGKFRVTVGGPEPFTIYSGDYLSTYEISREKQPRLTYGFTQLADGSFISLSESNQVHNRYIKREGKPQFVLGIHRAKTFEDIKNGNISTEFCFVDIPDLTFGFGDCGNSHSGTVAQGLIQLENGDIIATMYGQKTTDTTLCPYFDTERGYKFYLYSTWCIISHDGGHTFEYLSSVADVQTYPIADVNAEGYCEADIIYEGNGHIVSVIRTGGHEVYSPLYCSHSYDSGKTWEAPYEINSWGVYPRLFKLRDGTIAMLSGHIHTFLMFSEDGGVTWSEPAILEECDGMWDKSTSGYGCAFEDPDGNICVIFDDPKEGIEENAPPYYLRKVYLRKYAIK